MSALLGPMLVLASSAGPGGDATHPQAPPQRAARALLVGCTQYPWLAEAGRVPGSNTVELRGPVHDVDLFARALRERYGVTEAAMTRLVGWPDDEAARPTRANIERGFQALAAASKPGDWVVVFLAGHGSQQPSSGASLDDEPDGLDEIFLPADARPAPDGAKVPNALVDDDIARHVAAIRAKGAEVWLVVDACHSGTLLRGGSTVVRGLPPSALGVRGTDRGVGPASAAPAAKSSRAPEITPGVVAFYGAQSFGSAPEMELPEGAGDARPHGLFTFLLAREMQRVGAEASYHELIQRVVSAYQAFPCHLTVPMGQGDLDLSIGGGGRVVEAPLLVEFGGGEPRVDQGLLGGLERGVRLAVVADGAPLDATPVAELEITSAGTHDARASVVSGAVPADARTLRARVTKRPVGAFTITLGVVSPREEPLAVAALPEALRRLVEADDGRFRLAAEPASADWRIVVDGDRVHLRAAEHVGAFDRTDLDAAQAVRELQRLRRVHGMRRVCDLFGAPDGSLDVWVEHRPRGEAQGVRLAPGDRVAPGDSIRVMIRKTGGGIVDANVYYLDASYALQRLFPRGAQSPRLEPKADAPLELVPWTTTTDDALGFESVWVLAVPRGPSDPVLSLADLSAGEQVTRGASDEAAMRELLADLVDTRVTRGLSAPEPQAASTGTVYQIPLDSAWPDFAPPRWGTQPPAKAESAPALLADLPLPFAGGACFELRSSQGPTGGKDVLLLGTADAPSAVLIDLSRETPAGVREPAAFDPEAAFLFLEGGARLALYDTRDRGVFDLALLDADRDSVAETRWIRVDGAWSRQDGVRLPWLSQSHLVRDRRSGGDPVLTTRLAALARPRAP